MTCSRRVRGFVDFEATDAVLDSADDDAGSMEVPPLLVRLRHHLAISGDVPEKSMLCPG